jgi:hypothetical protein
MSDRDDIETTTRVDTKLNRRKVLSTTTAAAGVTGLTSAVASAEEDDVQLTEAKMEREMADAEVLAVRPPSGDVAVEDVKFSPDRIPEDMDMLVGKYKSASVPGESPFSVESYREWLQREAPPGYEDQFSSDALDDLYLQYDLGKLGIAGVSVNIGFGFGLKINSTTGNLDAEASADLYVNGATYTILSGSVGFGDDGLCVDAPLPYISKVADVEVCLNFTITNSPGKVCLETSVDIDACVNCLITKCCQGVSTPDLDECVYV